MRPAPELLASQLSQDVRDVVTVGLEGEHNVLPRPVYDNYRQTVRDQARLISKVFAVLPGLWASDQIWTVGEYSVDERWQFNQHRAADPGSGHVEVVTIATELFMNVSVNVR
jgi:hypothetical protein